MLDLTIVFYSANQVSDEFMANTNKQLLLAADGLPIVSVTQKPMDLGTNIVYADKRQSTFNLYQQVLLGAKTAKTKYVAMAEDDVLYPREHFHTRLPTDGKFAYNMNKWGIYTWSEPQIFSYKINRKVLHQMSCERLLLIEALEERFAKYPTPESINHNHFGEPGRYEDKNHLDVTVREFEEWFSDIACIQFTHPDAYGYRNSPFGPERKAHGTIRKVALPQWGHVEKVSELYK